MIRSHTCMDPESVNAILTRRYRGNCGQVMRNTVNVRVQASRDLPEDEWGLMPCLVAKSTVKLARREVFCPTVIALAVAKQVYFSIVFSKK